MSDRQARGSNTVFRERLDEEVSRVKGGKTAVGKAVGVDRRTVAGWIEGDSEPESANLAALADFLRCTMDYLWGRVDDRRGLYSGPMSPVGEVPGALVDPDGHPQHVLGSSSNPGPLLEGLRDMVETTAGSGSGDSQD